MSEEICPLCGDEFRTILKNHEAEVYFSTNPVHVSCLLFTDGEDRLHAIHTDRADEWHTPPKNVMGRTLDFVDGDIGTRDTRKSG